MTILWDLTINTNRKIEANRPDITIKNFKENTCIIIDVTVPADNNISLKEFQKLSNKKILQIEVTKMWKFKIKAIPVVTGALDMIRKSI